MPRKSRHTGGVIAGLRYANPTYNMPANPGINHAPPKALPRGGFPFC